ncbi:MAG: FtsX-like permease family protein [Dehalococcoidales bacterium]|nr:FtsX-like permease family protein [Dehalococcoidales bacterium]
MGNLRLAFFLAYKSILKGSRWTLIMIILVTSLSFANLILTPSIMSGVTEAINREQIDTLFGNIVIDPPEGRYYLEDFSLIESKLEQIPGISGIARHLPATALFEYSQEGTADEAEIGNWTVIGIDPGREKGVTTIYRSIIEGSYLGPGDTGSILLGVEIAGGEMAENKPFLTLGGAGIGEQVNLTFPDGSEQTYIVKGIFKARQDQANRLAYISADDMAGVLGLPADTAGQVLVRTEPGSPEESLIAQMEAAGIDGQVRSWLDYGGGVGGIVSSFSIIASLIGGIGLIVAGVVMFIVIYINVAHRKRQIGILRAIGVNRGVVLLSYLIQSLLYAVMGIIFGGIILGYVIKPYFDSHPIDLPIGLVSLVIDSETVKVAIFGLIAAAILAGIIPVLNLTRESIIKAIWGN